MPDPNYNTGDGLTPVENESRSRPQRTPTTEEAEAILTLVKGGWLKLTLTVSDEWEA
jgi:hypothetical protein